MTEHNYISLAQFEYAVFFEENYEEEIASGALLVEEILKRKPISKLLFIKTYHYSPSRRLPRGHHDRVAS